MISIIGDSMFNLFKNIIFVLFISVCSANANEVVNVYTSRHYESDKDLYKEFEDITGIKVNYISGKGKALFERIKSEGKNSPADVFITVDASNLWKVESEGYFQEIKSKKSEKA